MSVQNITADIIGSDSEVRDIYFNLPKLGNTSRLQRRALNRRLVAVYRTTQIDRERIIQKTLNEFDKAVDSQWRKIFSTLSDTRFINRLVEHVTNLYSDLKTNDNTDSQVQNLISEKLNSEYDKEILDTVIADAFIEAKVNFQEGVKIFHLMNVLFHWYVARSLSTALRNPKNYLTWWSVKKAAGTGFTPEDWFIIDILMGTQYQELLQPILTRQNLITVPGFTNVMFDSIREVFKKELYERAGGGLGAEALAGKIARELTNVRGTNLPEIPKYKYMLWARTEGVVVQTDALMELGKEADMEGKIWQTIGDSEVREGHVENEMDGIIPVNQDFSDGSSDAGSGSVSPYNCRCCCGPALLTA